MQPEIGNPDEQREFALAGLAAVRAEVAKRIVGQTRLVDTLLLSLMTQGHALLTGVPGLAKTRSVRSLASALQLEFARIQFTPDLLPSDITGAEMLEGGVGEGRRLRFERGPIFANLVLADEINRTPPRTQSALLEAMQERHVTAGGQSHPLPQPFLVLATQNPIEQEGTYPLPEAQLDRFAFGVTLGYPEGGEEREILRRTTAGAEPPITPVMDAAGVLALQDLVPRVPIRDEVIDVVVRLVRATRPDDDAPALVREAVAWGAGPRAGQVLVMAAKAAALLAGRPEAALEDVLEWLPEVLSHRVVLHPRAERAGIAMPEVLSAVRDAVRLPL
jgi:MoxR-like ATPase